MIGKKQISNIISKIIVQLDEHELEVECKSAQISREISGQFLGRFDSNISGTSQ